MEHNLLTALETNWVSLLVSIVFIAFLYYLSRRRVGFGYRVLIALGLGLVAADHSLRACLWRACRFRGEGESVEVFQESLPNDCCRIYDPQQLCYTSG